MASLTPEGLDLRSVCEALGRVSSKWFKIGIQLGIPRNKLVEFEKERDPLSAVVDYWLSGNVTESVVPISWKSIVATLKSEYVGEPGFAVEISKKYFPTKTEDTSKKGRNVEELQAQSCGKRHHHQLQNEVASKEVSRRQLQRHVEELQAERQAKEHQIHQLQDEVASKEDSRRQLQRRVEKLQAEGQAKEHQIHQLQDEEHANISRIADLESQLSQVCKSKEDLERRYHSRVHELQDRLDQANSTKKSLENYITFLNSSYSSVFSDRQPHVPGSPIASPPRPDSLATPPTP